MEKMMGSPSRSSNSKEHQRHVPLGEKGGRYDNNEDMNRPEILELEKVTHSAAAPGRQEQQQHEQHENDCNNDNFHLAAAGQTTPTKQQQQAWDWFLQRAESSSVFSSKTRQQQRQDLSVTPQAVSNILQHPLPFSSAATWCNSSTDSLFPPTNVAEYVLEQCAMSCKTSSSSQRSTDVGLRVALCLLQAPTAFATGWKAVSLLLQVLLHKTSVCLKKQQQHRKVKKYDIDEDNDMDQIARIVQEVQAFWSETMTRWTAPPSSTKSLQQLEKEQALEKVSKDTFSSQPTVATACPRDHISEWIPVLVHLHQQQQQSIEKEEDVSSLEASASSLSIGLQLMETLFQCLSSVENNVNWALDAVVVNLSTSPSSVAGDEVMLPTSIVEFSCLQHQRKQAQQSVLHQGGWQCEYSLLSLGTVLAQWMRRSDWTSLVAHLTTLSASRDSSWLSSEETDEEQEKLKSRTTTTPRQEEHFIVYLYHLFQSLRWVGGNGDNYFSSSDENQEEAAASDLELDLLRMMIKVLQHTPSSPLQEQPPHWWHRRRGIAKRIVERVLNSCLCEESDKLLHHWMDLLQGFSLTKKITSDAPPQVNGRNDDGMTCEESSSVSTTSDNHENQVPPPKENKGVEFVAMCESSCAQMAILDWMFILSSVIEAHSELIPMGFKHKPELRDQPCWKAVWAYLLKQGNLETTNHGVDKSHDIRTQQMEGAGALKRPSQSICLEHTDHSEWLEWFLDKKRARYMGKGCFQVRHRQTNHTADDDKDGVENLMVAHMTRTGSLVTRSLSSTTPPNINNTMVDEECDLQFWLNFLDPNQIPTLLADHDGDIANETTAVIVPVSLVVAVLVTLLVEYPVGASSSRPFRFYWLERFLKFLRLGPKAQRLANPSKTSLVTVVGWGSLYLAHAYWEQQCTNKSRDKHDDGGEVLYDRRLMQFIRGYPEIPPSHELVRALLPRPRLRPLLFQQAVQKWLPSMSSSNESSPWDFSTFHPSSIWWTSDDYDKKEVALWTLVQLVAYQEDDIETNPASNNRTKSSHAANYWHPLYEFILEGLPPVLTPVRSWFWEQALSDDFIWDRERPSDKKDVFCGSERVARVQDKLFRALLVRFFQFSDHPTGEPIETSTRMTTNQLDQVTKKKKKRTSGAAAYCSLSLDRLFVVTHHKDATRAVPVEDMSALFTRLVQLSHCSELLAREATEDWIIELAELLGVKHLMDFVMDEDTDNASVIRQQRSAVHSDSPGLPLDSTAGNGKHIPKRNTLLESSFKLCARVMINHVAGSGGVQHQCSFTKLRQSLCGSNEDYDSFGGIDWIMAQSNANAQKCLTTGEVSTSQIPFLRCCLRHHLADGLIHILVSLPSEATPSFSLVLGTVCALTALQQDLRRQMERINLDRKDPPTTTMQSQIPPIDEQGTRSQEDGSNSVQKQPQFEEPEARNLRFLSQTFPNFVDVCLPFLSSILQSTLEVSSLSTRGAGYHTRGGIATNAASSFRSSRYDVLSLEETNLIFRSIVYFCNEVQFILQPTLLSSDSLCPNEWNGRRLRQSLLSLYDVICTKQALGALFGFLERCVERTKRSSTATSRQALPPTRKKETTQDTPSHDLLLALDSSADVDRASREIRQIVLGTIRTVLRISSDPSCIGEKRGEPSFCQFVNRILGQCGHDLQKGLRGDSGGLAVSEYLSFVECIEGACECAVSVLLVQELPQPNDGWMVPLIETCVSVANLAEDIVCGIAIRNRS